jgi:hypothetical protein
MRGASFVASVASACILLAGCASSSEDIASAYVSPLTYQNYSCSQLAAEMDRISLRVQQVAGSVDHTATNDKIAMGVGIVLFWPALLMLKGNGPQHEELARLKGEYDAVNEQMIQRNCNSSMAEETVGPAANSNMRPYSAANANPGSR